MPNLLFRSMLSGLLCSLPVFLPAQVAAIDLPDPALEKQPRVIVLSGIAPQGGNDGTLRTFFLSAEHPFGPYQHIGVLYASFMTAPGSSYYDREVKKGSYEIGLYSKFFMHGRLSGRRSHLYYGPQIRFGTRWMGPQDKYAGLVPPTSRVGLTKFLFCLGGQYQLGHLSLDWSLPIGLESTRTSTNNAGTTYNEIYLCFLPGIALGVRL